MLNTLCVLAFATSGIIPGGVNCIDKPDDVSLSNETSNFLANISDVGVQQNIRQYLAKKKAQLDAITHYEYLSFRCAAIEIQSDYSYVFPKFKTKLDYDAFTQGIEDEVTIPKDLNRNIGLFRSLEDRYKVDQHYYAHKKMKSFFHTMYAFLTRCTQEKYAAILEPTIDLKNGLALRDVLFEHREAGDTDFDVIKKFCLSYARVRHGANGINRIYVLPIPTTTLKLSTDKERKVHLAEVLASIGILQAWKFSTQDLAYANIVHNIPPNGNLSFLSKSYYKIEHDGEKGKTVTLTGILPHLSLKVTFAPTLISSAL